MSCRCGRCCGGSIKCCPAYNTPYTSGLGDNAGVALDGLLGISAGATLSNAIEGGVVDAPVPEAPVYPIFLDFTAYGTVRLPPLASCPYGYCYVFLRGNSGSALQVAIAPAAGDPDIDNRATGQAVSEVVYMLGGVGGVSGTSLWVRRTHNSWSAVGGFTAIPRTLAGAAPQDITPWAGEREFHAHAAGGTYTMPPLSLMPLGSKLLVLAQGNPVTLQRNVSGGFFGSSNGTTYNNSTSVVLAARETMDITAWSSTIWRVH